jgi:hypothetical protein
MYLKKYLFSFFKIILVNYIFSFIEKNIIFNNNFDIFNFFNNQI